MNKKTLYILGLVIPAIFVFRALLSGSPASWGDAPYFHPEGLKELVNEPFMWTSRGNLFGGVNQFLWFAPIMLIYGLLGNVFNLNNEIIIRLLFYFPSLVLSFITPWLFAKFLKFDKKVAFFTSLFYVFNTYYLLLIDGGQVGVALAYGLFPLTLMAIIALLQNPHKRNFIMALILAFGMSMIDPRFLIIGIITSLFWLRKIKNVLYLLLVIICVALLSAYWLVPLLRLGSGALQPQGLGLQLVSLLNTLLLYQPHWPGNVFGQVTPPPWYFAVLPAIIFWGVLSGKKKQVFLGLVFLILAFLAKGDTHPLGGYYHWIINSIPFGFSLRDSSKFFAPLLLLAGILIGVTTVALSIKYKYAFLGVYAFLLLLVFPGFWGKLNFVLSGRSYDPDIAEINERIRAEDASFRVAWFPQVHPAGFNSAQKQSFDAKSLVTLQPFRSMNSGDYDSFNFIHNNKFIDWFKLFGIKYLVLQSDPRKVELNFEEKANYLDLQNRVATVSGILKVTNLPMYEVPEIKPRIMSADKLVAVVGSPDQQSPNIPFVFFEDGKLNPLHLQNTAKTSAYLYFDNKDQRDLEMSFLQKYFTSAVDSQYSQWAEYDSAQYLKWRFEALIRGVKTNEFDYGRGVAFSEVANERLEYLIPVKDQGEYVLAVRAFPKSPSDKLQITANSKDYEFTSHRNNFEWFIVPMGQLEQRLDVTIENKSGFWMVNTLALIPKQEFQKAQSTADAYVNHFTTLSTTELNSITKVNHWNEVEFTQSSPIRIKTTFAGNGNWLLFSDSYNPAWKLKRGTNYFSSLAAYSSVNLFYVNGVNDNLEVVFTSQESIRRGIYLTALTALILLIIYFFSDGK